MTKNQKGKWKFLIIGATAFAILFSIYLLFLKKEDRYLTPHVSLEFKHSIGAKEGDLKETFSFITDVAFDSSENVYVLDSDDCTIKIYDKNGRFIRSFGRKGQGPGEMVNPIAIKINKKNEILIFDRSLSRVIKFNLNGSFKNSFNAIFLSSYDFHDVEIDSQNYFYVHAYTFSEVPKLIHKYDPNGNFLKSFGEQVDTHIKRILPHVNAGRIALDERNNILHALPYPFVISILNTNGSLLKEMKINLPYAKPPHIFPDGIALQTLFNIMDISAWHKYIFVLAIVSSKTESISDPSSIKSILNIFDYNGRLINAIEIQGLTVGANISRDGLYYLIQYEPYPRLSVYKIIITY